jgi:ribosomal protein L12E/L44/L45/RPP1/RPP2
MITKWGLAAVEKAEREAALGKKPSQPGLEVQPPRPAKNVGAFKPDKTTNTVKALADGLGGTPEEKQFVTATFQAAKQAFEAQPETKAWRHNVAGALAFFIAGNVTLYQGAEEPSHQASQALFQAINQTIDEAPEFATMSNKDKQTLYELLIGFTALPLAIAAEAKEKKDAHGALAARAMSGELIRLVLKVDPALLRIENGAFVFGK